jgi:hypothetical protein
MGCAQQCRLGYFRQEDRLCERRFDLVDEERGLVLARAMMDYSGRLQTFHLTDGSIQQYGHLPPQSCYLIDLFKITMRGKIRQIEADFLTVPYDRSLAGQ